MTAYISAGLVIIAVGVRPNIDLLSGSGIEVNRGILVDNHMQSSQPDIYAAGDVAEAQGFFGERKTVLAIWPDAYRQGCIAGANMAGKAECYDGGLAMNSVELAGVPTISIGLTDPQEQGFEVLEKADIKNSAYRKVVLQNDVIVGAILVGNIERAGVYTGLVKSKVNCKSFKDVLLRDDFGIICLPSDYRKHIVTDVAIEV